MAPARRQVEGASVPIYEYECVQGHRFERRQGFHDEPLRACVECGQSARRLIQPAPIIFKGSGWYINDSRSNSGSSTSGDSAASSAETTGKTTETAGETKTETKAETKSETPTEAKAETKSETKSSAANAAG
jgi:putative FmdB family regulatory protein